MVLTFNKEEFPQEIDLQVFLDGISLEYNFRYIWDLLQKNGSVDIFIPLDKI